MTRLLFLFLFLSCMHRYVSYFIARNSFPISRFLQRPLGYQQAAWVHILQFDGGSRGNPGIGGSGAVIYRLKEETRSYDYGDEFTEVWSGSFFLGEKGITNNVAEYFGLIHGLEKCIDMELKNLVVEGDSQLVIRQIEGTYKIKSPELIKLHAKVMQLVQQIEFIRFSSVPRAMNSRADELANIAMDLRANKSQFQGTKKLTDQIVCAA
jgi:ribonuclease HI